ncbi:hypothetical protein [Synechococcus sp. CBW1006]|uniref:hypothetical protein n=1 Tax=Synechococcus sp. CBW1006 TaxID=1353138 RepID=UPI0018CF7207|nr:hypothetical protein [Synechococcus sp. CBW1006]QPN67678.1 hypothetical protein H8F26_05785 [Synechococcus sp. CBW1006]
MNVGLRVALLAGLGLALSAPQGWSADVSSASQSACMTAINTQYAGKVRNLKVVRSEFSQANSEVMVKAIGVRGTSENETWRCLVSNSGKVEDLSVVPSAPRSSSSSSVSEAAKSACMTAINTQYAGKVRNLKVVRSEFAQANSEVIINAIGVRGGSTNEKWRCLVSNSGKVQDLSVLGN